MRRTTALVTLGLTLIATAAAGIVGPSTAEAETRTVSAAEQDATLGYWTPERMSQAREVSAPVDTDTAVPHLEAGQELAWRNLHLRRAGTPEPEPAPTPQAPAVKGNAWNNGGKVSRTVGKVYFSLPTGDYTCTATSVDSANKSTVITAGHCVYQQGTYATRWVFIPGQTPTSEPFGRWTPARMTASPQWVQDGDINYDYAFVKLNTRNGRYLSDVTGSLPVSFASAGLTPLTSFGYSGAAPYYGTRLIYCEGELVPDSYGGTTAEGQACTMVSGASGGPRLTGFDGSTGQVAAINSFTYSAGPAEPMLWASRLGPDALTLYEQASR